MAHKAHILVADRDAANAAFLKAALESDNYRTDVVCSPVELLATVAESAPDAVLLGELDGGSGPDHAKSIKATNADHPAPVLIYSHNIGQQTYEQALSAEVEDLVEGRPSPELLRTRVPLLARLSTMQAEMNRRVHTAHAFGLDVDSTAFDRFGDAPFKVMYVNPSPDMEGEGLDFSKALIEADMAIRQESNIYLASDRLGDERFEACVVRLNAPADRESCLYLCSHIRDNPRLFNLPMLVVADEGIVPDVNEIYRAGASAVAAGDLDPVKIALHVKMLVGRQRFKWSLRDPILATLGPATGNVREGTYTKEFFDRHLVSVLSEIKIRKTELSVCVFSICNIPEVSERYGIEAAEILMRQMANWIKGLLRLEDTVARLSETDFGVILPNTSLDNARSVSNRIAGILHHSDFRLTDEIMEAIQVDVSLGVSDYRMEDDGPSLLNRAWSRI